MNDDINKAPSENEPADQTAALDTAPPAPPAPEDDGRQITEVDRTPRVVVDAADEDDPEIHVSCPPITSGEDLHAFVDELLAAGHELWGNHSGLYREQASTVRTDVPPTAIDPESQR